MSNKTYDKAFAVLSKNNNNLYTCIASVHSPRLPGAPFALHYIDKVNGHRILYPDNAGAFPKKRPGIMPNIYNPLHIPLPDVLAIVPGSRKKVENVLLHIVEGLKHKVDHLHLPACTEAPKGHQK